MLKALNYRVSLRRKQKRGLFLSSLLRRSKYFCPQKSGFSAIDWSFNPHFLLGLVALNRRNKESVSLKTGVKMVEMTKNNGTSMIVCIGDFVYQDTQNKWDKVQGMHPQMENN